MRGGQLLRGKRRQQLLACLFTSATDLGANTAVLMVIGVPLALLAAGSARCRAGFERWADDAEIGLRLAGDDAAGGVASIGAVETEANAADQVPDVVFAETRVRAADASGGAVEAVVDAA